MNFIFDIGNVLVAYKPEQFLQNLLNNRLDEEKMLNLIFKSNEWIELDKGAITQNEARSIFCTREPEHTELIIKVISKIPEMLTPMEETIELLYMIKEKGHKLYYLSNYHVKLSAYIQDRYSFFKLFDGGVFSCDIHIVKPNPAIYHHLLDKYKLNPTKCIFFDDTAENTIAAEKLGIKGVMFTCAEVVEGYI